MELKLPSRPGKVIVVALAVLAMASYFASGAAINNGDYWRVARAASIQPVPWQPLAEHYPFDATASAPAWPGTSMEALVRVVRAAHRPAGSSQFALEPVRISLLLIFLAGLWQVARETSRREGVWPVAAALAAVVLYAFYFRSLYEEAIVLATLPWLLVGISRAFANGRVALFVVAAAITLAAKVQMLFVLPVFLFVLANGTRLHAGKSWRVAVGATLLLASALLPIASMQAPGDLRSHQTAYNRFFNGLGWSAQGVAGWPVRDFDGRHRYFAAHSAELQSRTLAFEPFAGHAFLGTSYWPTADALARAEERGETPSPSWSELVAQGRIPNHLRHLVEHPALLGHYLMGIFAVTALSDYRLAYIRTRASDVPT